MSRLKCIVAVLQILANTPFVTVLKHINKSFDIVLVKSNLFKVNPFNFASLEEPEVKSDTIRSSNNFCIINSSLLQIFKN